MTSRFKQLMADAARLTRQGQLRDATAAIMSALGGTAPPSPAGPVFRTGVPPTAPVPPFAAPPSTSSPSSSTASPSPAPGDPAQPRPIAPSTGDGLVIDVQAREIAREPVEPPASAPAAAPSASPASPAAPSSPSSPSPGAADAADPIRAAGAPPVPPPSAKFPDVAPPTSRPESPAPTASGPGEFITGNHIDAGLARDFKLYIPPQAAEGRPLPLVVMLHGCTQNPDDFATGTRMNTLARTQGFFVLYPAQARHANSSGCWNWFKHNHQERGRGEPALIAGMTQAVMARHAVDAARVYVAGLSAGGAMAAILGSAYPELFAAIGVHSGLPVGAASEVSSAFMAMKSGAPAAAGTAPLPPTIVFHGDRDTTVHPANGDQVVRSAVQGAATPESDQGQAGGRGYGRTVYRAPDGRVLAEHWRIHGAGHAWAGGDAAGSYADRAGPDASAEMLRFFMAHPAGARA